MNELIRKAARLFKKRKSNKGDRNDFYLGRIYFKRIAFLYNLVLSKKAANELHHTSESIKPLGLKFGDAVETVLKAFDKPSFFYDNFSVKQNHKAYIFRQTISDINLMIQVQFYNDKLFFIAYDVARNVKDNGEKAEIVSTVIEKYLNTPIKSGEYPVISDKAGNYIVINEDVNFSICYLDGQHEEVQAFVNNGIMPPSKNNAEKKDREKLFYAF